MTRTADDQVVLQLKQTFRLDPEAKRTVIDLLPDDAKMDRHFDDRGMAVVRLAKGSDVDDVIDRLRKHEMIEFAEPVYIDSGSR
jgi:hypothetical protein